MPNPSNSDVYFSVECDLPSFKGAANKKPGAATGISAPAKETFRVAAGSTGEYTFVVAPRVSGVERGVLRFVAPDRKSFCWFGLSLVVAPPEADSEVAVEAPARGAVALFTRQAAAKAPT